MKATAIIITIGDELLIGQTIDTNSAWIAKELNKLGINLIRRIAIADKEDAINNALDESIPQTDIIIMTGGLGPTSDDITKPTLSKYFGGELKINETVFQHIKTMYAQRQKPYPIKSIAHQSQVPDYSTILMNRIGTAPGMWFEKNNCIIISLPGVPFEMQHLMKEEVLPRLSCRFANHYIIHHTLVVAGMAETAIADKIENIEKHLPQDIHIAYLPSPGIVKLRLTCEGEEKALIQNALNEQASLIIERLGPHLICEEDKSLEEILMDLLLAQKKTIALAESCTGGYLAHRLTNVPGISTVFKGGMVSYSNQAKHQLLGVRKKTLKSEGAVSEATVIEMALQARKSFKADMALSISGILGPGGGTPLKPVGLVWMALSVAEGRVITHKFQFHYDRIMNKECACNAALSMIIRHLQKT